MTFTIGLPAFDLATVLGLAVLLGAIGRGLQVRQDWIERGVGDFSYRYVVLIMASNLGIAYVARELLAPLAFAVCLISVALHGWIVALKLQSYLKNRLRI